VVIISKSIREKMPKYHLFILATSLIHIPKLLLMVSPSFGEKSLKLNCKIGKSSIIQIQKMINSRCSTVFGQWWENNIAITAKSNIYIEKG
jgi:hypothetical protein